MRYLIVAAVLSMTAPAYAQLIPAAPSLTAGPEFKGLRFDWEPAPGASWYELEYKANQNAMFTQLGSDLAASATSYRFRLPLHLFDWTYARYRLAACNASGCARSTEISVSNLRRDSVGYFKAAASTSYLRFGGDTDVTPDGLNFVASASGEYTGSGPFQTGALYVFRRGSNGQWFQRARLVPPVAPFATGEENTMNVGISADGNTVVLGMPNYQREYVDEESYDDVNGQVFVFHFNGTSWVRSRLYAGAGSRGSFGKWVSISDAGDLIALASGESTSAPLPRRTFIYRNINGSWQPVREIQAMPGTAFCDHGALSADGSTLVESCREGTMTTTLRNYVRTYSGANWTVRQEMPLQIASASSTRMWTIGLAVDRTGNTIAAQIYEDTNASGSDHGPSEVHVFHRDGAYSRVAVLSPGAWRAPEQRSFYGVGLAVSDDGSTIAVGDAMDNGYGTGPRAAPLNPATDRSGAVYVYRLRNTWRLANMVKPNYNVSGRVGLFGLEVTLNGNGHTLLVGHESEDSDAQGIDGDWANDGSFESGAVWMY